MALARHGRRSFAARRMTWVRLGAAETQCNRDVLFTLMKGMAILGAGATPSGGRSGARPSIPVTQMTLAEGRIGAMNNTIDVTMLSDAELVARERQALQAWIDASATSAAARAHYRGVVQAGLRHQRRPRDVARRAGGRARRPDCTPGAVGRASPAQPGPCARAQCRLTGGSRPPCPRAVTQPGAFVCPALSVTGFSDICRANSSFLNLDRVSYRRLASSCAATGQPAGAGAPDFRAWTIAVPAQGFPPPI